MRRIWAIAAKDLLETRRDRTSAIFTVIMPVAFTVFLGLLVGGDESRLPLAISNQDPGAAGRQLVRTLERSDVVMVEIVPRAHVNGRVDRDDAVAGLIIPRDYSQKLRQNERASLIFVRKSGSTAALSVAQEVRAAASRQALQTRATSAALEGAGAQADPGGDGSRVKAAAAVRASLAAPTLTTRTVFSGESQEIPTGFDHTSPGMIVNFVLFSILTAGVALIYERRQGTLQRLLTTRATRGELIGGKMTGMMMLTFAQQVILVAVGSLLGVAYFSAPVALLLVMIGLSALVSCIGLLLASLFNTEAALVSASVMVSMAMAAMSGGWFPLEITGPTFSAIGHALPTAWIIDAFRGIAAKGWGVADVLPAVGVAFAWAAGFLALGVWRFRSVTK